LREREVYHMTPAGRAEFHRLLCGVLRTYAPFLSDLDAGLFFLDRLAPATAAGLLEERRAAIHRYQAALATQVAEQHAGDPAHDLVSDRLSTLLDAELGWLERTIARLRREASHQISTAPAPCEPARR
jgi:hypothetical protein